MQLLPWPKEDLEGADAAEQMEAVSDGTNAMAAEEESSVKDNNK